MRIKTLALFACSMALHADTYNVIIIGSGPAGLAAALCAARMQLAPLVIEGEEPGGNLMYAGTIENWPGEPNITGPDLIGRMRDHAMMQGAALLSATVAKVDFSQSPYSITLTDGRVLTARSVIIASGTSPRKINCPGEAEYWGHGVAVCPICDGPLFKKKPIVVVGCGDEAITRALFMLQYTRCITLVCSNAELTGSAAMRNKLLSEPSIAVLYNSQVTEIIGDQTRLTGVRIDTQEQVIPASGVFLALGEDGRSDWCGGQLACDDNGFLLLTGPVSTAIPGVFVTGTVAITPSGRPYTLALAAAGSGCMAALAAWNYMGIAQKTTDSQPCDILKQWSNEEWSAKCYHSLLHKQLPTY